MQPSRQGKQRFFSDTLRDNRWPDNGKFSAAVVFCSYGQATKAAQAVGLIDKPAKKPRSRVKRRQAVASRPG